MKTKEEILKMTPKKLEDYKWSGELDDRIRNTDCAFCDDCSGCNNCFRCIACSNCSFCRDAEKLKYAICNVEFTKEEYEKKMLELNK